MIKNCDVYNVTAKMAINIEAFTYSGRHIGFPVDDILPLNAAFCRGGAYSGKVIKTHHCIFIVSKDMSMEAARGGGILPPPPTSWTSEG